MTEYKKQHYELVCSFCHEKFIGDTKTSKFCDAKCNAKICKIAKRIRNIFCFEPNKTIRELDRLEKLGINYSFPSEIPDFETLNQFYGLKPKPLEGINDYN